MVHRGQGVQIIYGPGVTVIKANLEDYLEHAPKELYEPQKDAESTGQNISEDDKIETKAEEKKIVDTIVNLKSDHRSCGRPFHNAGRSICRTYDG